MDEDMLLAPEGKHVCPACGAVDSMIHVVPESMIEEFGRALAEGVPGHQCLARGCAFRSRYGRCVSPAERQKLHDKSTFNVPTRQTSWWVDKDKIEHVEKGLPELFATGVHARQAISSEARKANRDKRAARGEGAVATGAPCAYYYTTSVGGKAKCIKGTLAVARDRTTATAPLVPQAAAAAAAAARTSEPAPDTPLPAGKRRRTIASPPGVIVLTESDSSDDEGADGAALEGSSENPIVV